MKIDDISIGDRLSYQYQGEDGVSWTQTVTVQNVKSRRVTISFETPDGDVDTKDVSPKTLGETFYG